LADEPPDPPAGQGIRAEVFGAAEPERYVDAKLGFELTRPARGWRLSVTGDPGEDGLVVPVTLQHGTGATVVLQIAPAVATPLQYAERLTTGLTDQLGATIGGLEPLSMSAGAVGFRFRMDSGGVMGRVAVREGSAGNVFMMLATWPETAPPDVAQGVDAIFASIKPVTQPPAGQQAAVAP
jgi:hypothetical protein